VPRVDPVIVEQTLAADAPKRRRTAAGLVTIVVVVALLAVLAATMVPHPVGPARTFGKYNGKAVSTAESAISDVRTAALVARARRDGNAFGPYTSIVVSDAEESVSGVQGTFDSIQPPDTRADELQQELDPLLSDALDKIRQTRIAVRRGDTGALTALVPRLDAAAARLESFTERHS
jgi:hypothetical protein